MKSFSEYKKLYLIENEIDDIEHQLRNPEHKKILHEIVEKVRKEHPDKFNSPNNKAMKELIKLEKMYPKKSRDELADYLSNHTNWKKHFNLPDKDAQEIIKQEFKKILSKDTNITPEQIQPYHWGSRFLPNVDTKTKLVADRGGEAFVKFSNYFRRFGLNITDELNSIENKVKSLDSEQV